MSQHVPVKAIYNINIKLLNLLLIIIYTHDIILIFMRAGIITGNSYVAVPVSTL